MHNLPSSFPRISAIGKNVLRHSSIASSWEMRISGVNLSWKTPLKIETFQLNVKKKLFPHEAKLEKCSMSKIGQSMKGANF